ncbi:MAG: hypothetical protein ACON5A_04400 [Candidatus Comchoanobacterales bacterium]
MIFDLSPISQKVMDEKQINVAIKMLPTLFVSDGNTMNCDLTLELKPQLKQLIVVDMANNAKYILDHNGFITRSNLDDLAMVTTFGKLDKDFTNEPAHVVRSLLQANKDSSVDFFQDFLRNMRSPIYSDDRKTSNLMMKATPSQLDALKSMVQKNPIAANILVGLPVGILLHTLHALTLSSVILSAFSMQAINNALVQSKDDNSDTASLADSFENMYRVKEIQASSTQPNVESSQQIKVR